MTNSNKSQKPLIMSATQLTKSFGAVKVLHGIDLEIRGGEIHALLGENGAGKSTLVKILAGFEKPDSGELQLLQQQDKLQPVGEWNNEIAENSGIVLIHQEFNLAEQLTVAENIFLGNEMTRGVFLQKKVMRQKAMEYLGTLDCDIDPDTPVHTLAVSAKQMVEIAKTRAKRTRVLILDEPTAVLTQKESDVLFELIEKLRAQGVAIVYISHKLDEIKRLADRITIVRDGSMVGNYAGDELSKDDMARLMVGRELTNLFPRISAPGSGASVVMRVENVRVSDQAGVSFCLHKGEVLGFSGLVGSGRSALMESIVGLRKLPNYGDTLVEINGQRLTLKSLGDAKRHGVAYLTKDRKGSGLLLNMGLRTNFSLFALDKFSRYLIDTKAEQQAFRRAVKTFDIRLKDESMIAGNLSGGNQQKLLLAKIMEAEPGIIIIDEPTRGIDIGTRGQIYHFIAELISSGHSVILISSDITEIIGLSHRVAVMYHGEIAGILEGDEIEEHEIMRYATGLKQKPIKSEPLCA